MSKVQKSRLGRGLSSLISVSELPVQAEVAPAGAAVPASVEARINPLVLEPTTEIPPIIPTLSNPADPPAGGVTELPIDRINPNPHQPRKDIDQAKVAELAASLKTTGLIQPVVVRKAGDGYQLIAGERRWRAARLAGFDKIPAIVREVSTVEQAQMALVENIQREDLNPIDRARSYRALMDQLGLTQAELASRLGEDRSSVANYLRLIDLPEPVRDMLRDGSISLGHAKLLAGVDDPDEQVRLANLVKTQELSVRNLERMIAGGAGVAAPDARPTSAGPSVSAHIRDLEQSIARQLGLRVQLKASAKKGHGRLVLHYASLDQFDGLLERLGVSVE